MILMQLPQCDVLLYCWVFGEIYWQRPWKQYEVKLRKKGVKEDDKNILFWLDHRLTAVLIYYAVFVLRVCAYMWLTIHCQMVCLAWIVWVSHRELSNVLFRASMFSNAWQTAAYFFWEKESILKLELNIRIFEKINRNVVGKLQF